MMHYTRMTSPPSQESFNFTLSRAVTKHFNQSHRDLLFDQMRLFWNAELSLSFCFSFLTIYPDRGRLLHAERHISHCCRDNWAHIFEMPLFWAGRRGQNGKLTRRFCCSAAVGSTGAVPDHKLSALHHGLKRLPVNAYTKRIWQLISSDLLSTILCSRMPLYMKRKGQGTKKRLRFGTVILSLPSTHVEQNCLHTRILSPFAAAWPRKQPWAQPWTQHQQWPSPHTTSARKRPGESTDLREDTYGHKGSFTSAV